MKEVLDQAVTNKGESKALAFVLFGLLLALLLVPDTGSLEMKRPLAACFLATLFLGLAKRSWSGKPGLLFNRRWLVTVVVFLSTYALAWGGSPYPTASPYRWEVLLLFAAACLLSSMAPEAWRRPVFGGWMAGLALVSLYAIAQRLGWEPVRAYARFGSQSRSVSSFGNANLLAAFLVLSWPLGLLLARFHRWAVLGLAATALLFTESRGGIIAVAIQVGLLEVWRERGHLRDFLSRGLPPILGVLLIGILWQGGHLWRPTLRAELAQETLKLVAEKPVLGWGPGSFPLVMEAKQGPETTAELKWTNQFAEHPHSWILMVLFEAGLLGLAAFIAILWLARLWPGPLDSIERNVICLAVGGFLIQAAFDKSMEAAGLACLFGVLIGCLPSKGERLVAIPKVAWLISGLFVVTSLGWSIRPVILHWTASNGQDGQGPPIPSPEILELQWDVLLHPKSASAWVLLANAYAGTARYPEGADAYEKAFLIHPDANLAINWANCLYQMGDFGGAEQASLKAIQLDGGSAISRYCLALALHGQGRKREALVQCDAILKLEPGDPATLELRERILK